MTTTYQPGTWTADPAASTAAFSVRNFLFNTVRGHFPVRAATVTVGPDGQPSAVNAVLEANGFDTGNPKRDTHIKTAQFLDGATYPVLTFVSSSVTETAPGEWRIAGDLTVRDRVSPLVLTARADGAPGSDKAVISATGQINRRKAGVASGPSFVVGSEVAIEISIVLLRSAA